MLSAPAQTTSKRISKLFRAPCFILLTRGLELGWLCCVVLVGLRGMRTWFGLEKIDRTGTENENGKDIHTKKKWGQTSKIKRVNER